MPPKLELSRGLLDRIRLVAALKQVFVELSVEIAVPFAELLAPDLRGGETMPDAELENELYVRLLERRLAEATAAEHDYRLAGIRAKSMGRDRDHATAQLSRQLGGLRQIVDLALGKGSSTEFLGLKGRTERRQTGIFHQAAGILSRLDSLTPTDPLLKGVSSDPKAWKAMIEPAFQALKTVRKSFVAQEKSLDALLISKKAAFRTFDETARGLIRIAEGQCQLLGRKDLAKRIRRLSRKRQKPGPKPKKTSGRKAK